MSDNFINYHVIIKEINNIKDINKIDIDFVKNFNITTSKAKEIFTALKKGKDMFKISKIRNNFHNFETEPNPDNENEFYKEVSSCLLVSNLASHRLEKDTLAFQILWQEYLSIPKLEKIESKCLN